MYELNQTVYATGDMAHDDLPVFRGNAGTIAHIYDDDTVEVNWRSGVSRVRIDEVQPEPFLNEDNYQDVVDATAKHYSEEIAAMEANHRHEMNIFKHAMEASTEAHNQKVNNLQNQISDLLEENETLTAQLEEVRAHNANLRSLLESAQGMMKSEILTDTADPGVTDEYPAIEVVKDIPSGLFTLPNSQRKMPVVDTYVIRGADNSFVKGFYGFNISPYPDKTWIKFYPENDCTPVNEPATITGTVGEGKAA